MGLKEKSNWKKILLGSTVLANMGITQFSPVTQVFADEIETSDSRTKTITDTTKTEESKAGNVTNEKTTEETVTTQSRLADTEETTNLSTGRELANRANPMDVQGLNDDQLQSLANVLYGDMAKFDPNFGMSVVNDKGKTVIINFNRGLSINSRSTGAGGTNINYSYNITRGAWSAWGEFFQKLYIDGKLAYCMQPNILFIPGEGFVEQTELDGITLQQKNQINNLLNFGAKDSDSNEFYVATQLAIWESLGWSINTNLGTYENLKAQISSNNADFVKVPSFAGQQTTVKVGESIRLEDINGVLSNFNVEVDGTNSDVKINGNEIIVTPSVNSNDGRIDLFRNSYYSGNQYFYVNGNGSQVVSTGGAIDPTVSHIPVKVIKEGDLQIGKQDAVTGNMIPNTVFEGTIGEEQVKFITDADGWASISKKYVHGTVYNLVETVVPVGYFLDQTPITGTIIAGEVTKIVQKNDIQKAQLTVEKTKEVYNAEDSTKQGKPVYEMIEAPEISFTRTSIKDITAPDGKTVIEKAGEYTDTQVTDSDGSAIFNPFYNGEQNEYLLTEEVPENYRSIEPKKIVIPYDESSVSVVAHTEKIQNLLKKGKLVLNKKNQIDPNNPLNLAGAKFRLTGRANTNTADVDLVFDTTIEATNIDLKAGSYIVSEIKYPSGFTQPDGQIETRDIVIEDQQTTTIDWENKPITSVIKTTPKTTTATPVSTKTTGTLPHTGERSNSWVSVLGAIAILTASSATVLYRKRKEV